MSILLSPGELEELTGKRRPIAQARVLRDLGVPFKARAHDGILLVSRSAAEQALSGVVAATNEVAGEWNVDMEAIRNHGKKAAAH